MRWSLRYQILAPFAGAMLATVVALSASSAYLASRRSEEVVRRQLAGVAQTLQSANFPLTGQVLKQMRGLSGAEFVLADPKGNVVAASQWPATMILPLLSNATDAEIDFDDAVTIEGEAYFHAAVPAPVANGPTQQTIHIFYPERRWRESRWQAVLPSVMLGSGALFLVAVIAVALSRRLIRPIRQIGAHAARLAEHDFAPIPRPRLNDEHRDLVDAVNSMARQLEESLQVIKRTERWSLLGQLSGGLAHELRNAATGARLAIQLHERRCNSADRESIAVALRQLELTEQQLRRLLSVGKRATSIAELVDLADLIEEVRLLVEPNCRHREVSLQIELDGHLRLEGDREQLQQLLMNLLLNALEAAGTRGWVRVQATAGAHGAITLRVLDSGPGPAADVAARLFEPFVTGKPEGIGLGLTVVQQIALAHGATVRLASVAPTCFEVRFPTSPIPSTAIPSTPADVPATGPAIAGASP
jgi:signal transduction histidine kinase